jgi:hypothetical protein
MSQTITIKNEREFRRKLKRLKVTHGKRLNKIQADNTARMQRLAMRKAPKGTSKNLFQNIKIVGKGTVVSGANYSQAVEEGTRPHTIRIKSKNVLAGPKRAAPSGWDNFSRDWAVYGKKVQHPGTSGQPFLKPAWEFARRKLISDIKKMFRK